MKPIYYFLIGAVFLVTCGNRSPKESAQIAEEKTGPLFDLSAVPEEPVFDLKTSAGVMRIKLYKETPLHRDNFVKLVAEHYYDGIIFHRVIQGFMIQAGETGETPTEVQLKYGDEKSVNYNIPAEFVTGLTHKIGALAAARMPDHLNPQKESSGSQFYIVHSAEGCKHLDGNYTVFGEVIDGFEVIDLIAGKPVNGSRPTEEVKIISITPVF